MFRCMFFFFKHKTAYEMRISDWSSDVCSSDLRAQQDDVAERDGELDLAQLAQQLEHPDPDGGAGEAAAEEDEAHLHVDVAAAPVRDAAGDAGADHLVEIGRASCRDRVFQYV